MNLFDYNSFKVLHVSLTLNFAFSDLMVSIHKAVICGGHHFKWSLLAPRPPPPRKPTTHCSKRASAWRLHQRARRLGRLKPTMKMSKTSSMTPTLLTLPRWDRRRPRGSEVESNQASAKSGLVESGCWLIIISGAFALSVSISQSDERFFFCNLVVVVFPVFAVQSLIWNGGDNIH